MTSKPLSDLDFVDLYLCLEGDAPPHYCRNTGKGVEYAIEVPPDYFDSIKQLTALLQKQFTTNEMGMIFEGMRLRAAKARMSSGQLWVSLRKIIARPIPLDELGFNKAIVPHLRNLGKRDGLIVICGATGQGKTTTACSILSEYLDLYGGVAFSIEDPVEYNLEGRHGKKGYCYQVEIYEDDEWAEMLKRSLRWHPRYIFVGEIRTPGAANQLLRAATSGHLVITTVHAGSVEESLEGILQLGVQAIGNRAPLLLAAGVTGIIHQNFAAHGLQTQTYLTEPYNPSSPFRACIREQRIGQIRTFIDQQNALLAQGGKIFRDGSA